MSEPIKPKPRKIEQGKQNNFKDNKGGNNRKEDGSDTTNKIISTINHLQGGLKKYPIRELVIHAEELGPYLKRQKLETNQIRKFLDAINQLKAKMIGNTFSSIENDVVLLKPKLAYAAARQPAVKSLNKVMSAAIDNVYDDEDFERLVQLIEAIIAYHKAEDGK
jgi:CRISPR-associated protein Csm2